MRCPRARFAGCSYQTRIRFAGFTVHGHGDMDMETWAWRHGHGDIDMRYETWQHGEMETLRHGHGDTDVETRVSQISIFLKFQYVEDGIHEQT